MDDISLLLNNINILFNNNNNNHDKLGNNIWVWKDTTK